VSRPPLAEALDLALHPEGGWFRETWRAAQFVPAHGSLRSAGTAIYFLLGPDEHSEWHRVRSDELWLWHRGGALTLSLGGTDDAPGPGRDFRLGPDVEGGEQPQVLVPAGMWQCARPAADIEVLVSCVVVPGFDFADFTLAEQ
jgi:predicted cupin superfamily sugar epimerase